MIIIFAFVARIIYVQHGKKTIPTSYPLQKIELSNNSVSIYIQKNAKLNDVVKLDFFRGISPNMTDSEVTNLLGLSPNISERYGSKFNVYYTKFGRIEIGNSSGSLSDDEFYDKNICMFFREDFSKEDLFKPAVINYIPDNISDKQIGIFLNNKCDFVINLSSKKEDWIQWSFGY